MENIQLNHQISSNSSRLESLKSFGVFLVGVAGGVTLGAIPAILIGIGVALSAKGMQKVVPNKGAKKFFSFIYECGKDIAINGALGALINKAAGKAANSVAGRLLKLLR
ncbi:hypothetical protein BDF19DRAFT_462588 [Syncephalis fuscata]|nr:hypothetical protein BDF19DRAFT_462588 [Syncephalis fuscata]